MEQCNSFMCRYFQHTTFAASQATSSGDPFAPSRLPQGISKSLELPQTMSQDLEPRFPGAMALDRGVEQAYQAYNEEAFRHFLAIERKRAERSGRSLLLLLVDLKTERDGRAGVAPSVAPKLFSALHACVREIDFIGWYRGGRVVGAVLTQGAEAPAPDESRRIGERVAEVLHERLPSHIGRRIQVRVLQLRAGRKN
jgi:hypothetical protein